MWLPGSRAEAQEGWPTGFVGIPGWLSGKKSTCQCRSHRRCGFDSWVGKIPWRRKWQPAPAFLPGKAHGQIGLPGYGPCGCKGSDTTERPSTHARLSLSVAFGILPEQGSNPCLLHWRVDSLPLSPQGSPETRRFLVEEEGSQGLQSSKQSRSCGHRGGVGPGFKKNGNSWKMRSRNVIGSQPGSRRLSEWH